MAYMLVLEQRMDSRMKAFLIIIRVYVYTTSYSYIISFSPFGLRPSTGIISSRLAQLHLYARRRTLEERLEGDMYSAGGIL